MNEHGGWICPDCGEMNNLPTGHRCDCEQDEEEIEYMPIWATIAGPLERLHDEWTLEGDPEQIARRQEIFKNLDESRTGWGKLMNDMTIDALADEWADEHERDDSEGWDDES